MNEMDFKSSLLPTSQEEVDILTCVLDTIIKKQFIMDKDLLLLCNGDDNLFNKIKNCLIETEAITTSPYLPNQLSRHTANTEKYFNTKYFNHIYNEYKENSERKELELIKLRKDLEVAKKQAKLALPAFILAAATFIWQVLSLTLGLIEK